MSTKVTKDIRITERGIQMVDSYSLQLVLGSSSIYDLASQHLTQYLTNQGYQSITPSLLHFLSALECGVNYGSEIARNLGVSRQMVAKTVKELCNTGYLEQTEGKGKQKNILFTERGEQLMADTRACLLDMDAILIEKFGEEGLTKLTSMLTEAQSFIGSNNVQ